MNAFTKFQFDPIAHSTTTSSAYAVTAESGMTLFEVAYFPFSSVVPETEAQARNMAEQFALFMELTKGHGLAPILEIDKVLFKESNGVPHERCRLERAIVYQLFNHLESKGFKVCQVDDYEDIELVTNAREAMEYIFNLDCSRVFFRNQDQQRRWVDIVLGNGVDCISDYGCPKDDSDGWNKAMEEFSPEDVKYL